jgi:hypothetical protein
MGWKDKVWEFLKDEPIYAPAKCDPYNEGWRFAFNDQTAKLKVAEKRLAMLAELADAIIEYDLCPQYGRDINAILAMSKEELFEDYGDN